jgi:branched-chain amino acid transport system substrate-binding protein
MFRADGSEQKGGLLMRSVVKRCLVAATLSLGLLLSVSGFGQSSGASTSASSSTPITFGIESQDTGPEPVPFAADGTEVWAKYVNAHGGLDGHPVKLVRCDDEGNAQLGAQCARTLADNPNVVAVVGGEDIEVGLVSQPIFATAGLLYVCDQPVISPEMQGKTAYCVSGGSVTSTALMAKYAAEKGYKRIGAIQVAGAPGEAEVASLKSYLAKWDAGATIVSNVPVPSGTSDLLPDATAVLQGNPQIIINGVAPSEFDGVYSALQQAGVGKIPIMANSASYSAAAAKSAGPAIDNGLFAGSQTPVGKTTQSNPDIALFLKAVKKYDPSIQIGDASFGGWQGGEVMAAAIKQMGDVPITRKALLSYFMTHPIKNVPLFPASMSWGDPLSVLALPAAVNLTGHIWEYTAKNGPTVVANINLNS